MGGNSVLGRVNRQDGPRVFAEGSVVVKRFVRLVTTWGGVAALFLAVSTVRAEPVTAGRKTDEPRLALKPHDRIVYIGGTFAEQMGTFGYLETIVTSRRPSAQLSFRNLGWSADTPTLQPRPLNFGDMHTHLTQQKADVIFLCFGMAESFAGQQGLPKFRGDLRKLIESLRAHTYNGKTPPRLVLVSPIAHETLGPDLPDPTVHNQQLKAYTSSMRRIAGKQQVPFIDLYAPTLALMQDGSGEKLTFDGIHLTQYGYWVAAQLMAKSLGLLPPRKPIEIDAAGKGSGVRMSVVNKTLPLPPRPSGARVHRSILQQTLRRVIVRNLKPGRYALKIDGAAITGPIDAAAWAKGVAVPDSPAAQQSAEKLRRAIVDKNQQFFYRHRAVNGEYIYGRRKKPFGVVNFPPEMKKLDRMVRERDGRIWKLAKPFSAQTFELGSATR